MVIYWPTPGFEGRTFKLCVLTRWDFNFCVRSSSLRGKWSNRRGEIKMAVSTMVIWVYLRSDVTSASCGSLNSQSEASRSLHQHYFVVRRLWTFEVLAKCVWPSNRTDVPDVSTQLQNALWRHREVVLRTGLTGNKVSLMADTLASRRVTFLS